MVKFNYLGERARKNFKTSGNKQKKENNGYLEIKLEAGRGERAKFSDLFMYKKSQGQSQGGKILRK